MAQQGNLFVNKSWELHPDSTWGKGSKNSHNLLSNTDTPQAPPNQLHSKCNFKNWKPSVRETLELELTPQGVQLGSLSNLEMDSYKSFKE